MAHSSNEVHVIVRVPYPRPAAAAAASAPVQWTPDRDQQLLMLMDYLRIEGHDDPDCMCVVV